MSGVTRWVTVEIGEYTHVGAGKQDVAKVVRRLYCVDW